MRDSRLRVAAALLDDARTILVDIVDERPADANLRDFNQLDSARQFINAALVNIQTASKEAPHDGAA